MAKSKTVTFSYNPNKRSRVEVADEDSLTLTPTKHDTASRLVRIIDSYNEVSLEEDGRWLSASLDVVSLLRDWRRAYKQLDARKRFLKKSGTREPKEQQQHQKEQQRMDESPASTPEAKDIAHTPATSDTSANDKSESDESDRRAGERPAKRRRRAFVL